MSKKSSIVQEMPIAAYGVCCSAKSACSLSYENEQFGRLGQLLQTSEGAAALKGSVAGYTKLFQRSAAACSVCHQPVVNTAAIAAGGKIDVKRLERVLRLRNQLLGLEILSA